MHAIHECWPLARADMHAEWTERTDPRGVEPKVPPAMREAADLVRGYGDHVGAAQDRLVERLGQDVGLLPEVKMDDIRVVAWTAVHPVRSWSP